MSLVAEHQNLLPSSREYLGAVLVRVDYSRLGYVGEGTQQSLELLAVAAVSMNTLLLSMLAQGSFYLPPIAYFDIIIEIEFNSI